MLGDVDLHEKQGHAGIRRSRWDYMDVERYVGLL